MASITENSRSGGVQIVTIAAGPTATSPTSQKCRSCLVQHKSGTATFMNVGAAATTDHFALGTNLVPVPIDNLNKLSFIGTVGDKVQILWRD